MVEKRLFFEIKDRIYTLPVTSILEIVKVGELAWIPNVKPCLVGLMNIRGYIIPIIDGGLLLGFGKISDSDNRKIIIVEVIINGKKVNAGIIVDLIQMISIIKKDEMQSREKLAGRKLHNSIIGISYLNKKSVMHMDANHLFTDVMQ
jgi:purine-binding chemotaxis protein CheW